MKTLVIVEIPAAVLSLPLSDLITVPAEGRFFVFDGKRYQITETTEFLGFRGSDGKEVGANVKLLQLLKAVYDGNEMTAMAVLAKLKHIGSEDKAGPATTGGIILPSTQSFASDFDSVIFVRASSVKSDNTPPIKLSALAATDDRQDLLAGDAAAAKAPVEG